jgi:hypothetical protein
MENKKISLSNGEVVEILGGLNWGQKEEIQNIFIRGAKYNAGGLKDFDGSVMIDGKFAVLKLCVVGVEKDGVVNPFSKEWINNLDSDDGDLVFNTVNELTSKKKAPIQD